MSGPFSIPPGYAVKVGDLEYRNIGGKIDVRRDPFAPTKVTFDVQGGEELAREYAAWHRRWSREQLEDFVRGFIVSTESDPKERASVAEWLTRFLYPAGPVTRERLWTAAWLDDVPLQHVAQACDDMGVTFEDGLIDLPEEVRELLA